MKKFIFSLALFLLILPCYAAAPVNEKVLRIFNETFGEVQNVVWNESALYYSVSFVKNNVRASITYDKNGRFIQSRRYYSEDYLPFNILMAIKEKYTGRSIFGVTETVNDGVTTYYIKLQDRTHWYLIKSTAEGITKVTEKVRKA